MCISVYGETGFVKTRILAGQVWDPDRLTLLHTLGYQNVVRAEGSMIGADAMLVMLPVAMGGYVEAVDTATFAHFLEDMEAAVDAHIPKAMGLTRGGGRLGEDEVLLQTVGLFTWVFARKSSLIPAALEQVPVNRRPDVSGRMSQMKRLERLYPGEMFALACYDRAEANGVQTDPFLVLYEPINVLYLRLPGLDQHDGSKAVDLAEMVEVDHTLIVSVVGDRLGYSVRYQDAGAAVGEWSWVLPDQVRGTKISGKLINGDWEVDTMYFIAYRDLEIKRVAPPGISKSEAQLRQAALQAEERKRWSLRE